MLRKVSYNKVSLIIGLDEPLLRAYNLFSFIFTEIIV